MGSPPSDQLPKKSPSKAWYLLPIFFTIIGGLIMYLVLKDDDRRMAKKGLYLGIILTVVGIAIAVAVNIAIFASIGTMG